MVVSPPWPSSPARWARPPCSRGAPRSTPSRPGAGGWSSSGDLETDIGYMRAANSCAGRRWHSAVVFIRDRLILSPVIRLLGRTWLNSLCSVSDIVIRMKRHTRGNNIPDQPIKKNLIQSVSQEYVGRFNVCPQFKAQSRKYTHQTESLQHPSLSVNFQTNLNRNLFKMFNPSAGFTHTNGG